MIADYYTESFETFLELLESSVSDKNVLISGNFNVPHFAQFSHNLTNAKCNLIYNFINFLADPTNVVLLGKVILNNFQRIKKKTFV